MLAQALRPFILRRTKRQVARELPEKTEQTIFCEMDAEQRKLYDELRNHYRDAAARVSEQGHGEVEDARTGGAAAPAAGGLPSGTAGYEARSEPSAKLEP